MIQIENILKVLDIQKNQVSEETVTYLSNFTAYTDEDNILKEHLINIHDAMEDVNEDKPENRPYKKIISEVKELHALCDKNKAGYIRFIVI